jgi:hypothetical protein
MVLPVRRQVPLYILVKENVKHDLTEYICGIIRNAETLALITAEQRCCNGLTKLLGVVAEVISSR